MSRIVVFGGTSEGRVCAEKLAGEGYDVSVFVATSYGGDMLSLKSGLSVRTGRLDLDEIIKTFKNENFDAIIDATHPYAALVTEYLVEAAGREKLFYLRIGRDLTAFEGAVTAENAAAAAELLNNMDGRVLLTTGSKELEVFTRVRDFRERVYARVLPDADVVRKCGELGLTGKNLICMQGPFTHELNVATIKMLGINIIVTKDTGGPGGFPEKLSAARECGVKVIVIKRPKDKGRLHGGSVDEVVGIIKKRFPVNGTDEKGAHPRFPLFISLEGKNAFIIGGGEVAARRARALLDFGAKVTVIAPEISQNMRELSGRVIWKQECYSALGSGCDLVIAATDDREVNRRIGEDAKKAGLPVSVADNRGESTFWFPAIAKGAGIVCGLVSEDGNHGAVKNAAEKIRKTLSEGL